MTNEIQLDQIRANLFQLLQEGGDILQGYFSSPDIASHAKKDMEIVTNADTDIDTLLRQKLAQAYPFIEFLTEETAPQEYASFREKEYVWVIDPVDGTTNFSRKYPRFATSVALVYHGTPILGVIYDPVNMIFYWAQKDKPGAYRGKTELTVSKTNTLKESVVLTDLPYSLEGRQRMLSIIDVISQHVRQIKIQGCAALDLVSIAEGLADTYLHTGLKPWDVAAAALIIEKAGGKITKLDGSEWDIFNKGPLVSNVILHEKLLSIIPK